MRGAAARFGSVAAVAVLAGLCSGPAAARPRLCRHCFPDLSFPHDAPPVEGVRPNIPYGTLPDAGEPPLQAPSGPRRGAVVPSSPYTQGFVLTYTVRHDGEARQRGPLSHYADVGRALAGCWASSDVTGKDWREVTLRVSFKADGSINGVPRIQHLDATGDPSVLSQLRTGFLSTLGRCAPLPLSPSLGAAIAGQIFAIRFIQAKDT